MRRLTRFFRLPATRRRLFIQAARWLVVVRLGLWVLPFRKLQPLVARLRGVPRGPVDAAVMREVAWAVQAASRYVPAATCLTQALTGQILLQRRGYPAQVEIGVAKDESGQFMAHAWLRCDGVVLIGGSAASLRRYTPLHTMNGAKQ
ncbi:MAG: lasso peptide biosynthesis B2 protein [Chloroflexi bacterium]|nr:lasso peptide biosynthesis B2 protein [Chloroflexota bacterium]